MYNRYILHYFLSICNMCSCPIISIYMINYSILAEGRYSIPSPEVLCFYDPEHRDNTLSFFSTVESYPKSIKHFITLDLKELKLMTAAAAAYFFAMVSSQQIYTSNNYFHVKLPKDRLAKELLINSGLHSALKKGGAAKFQKLWESSSFLCGNNSQAMDFLEVLRARSNVSPLPAKLAGALKETFTNINHHAYKGPTSLLSTTWWCYFYTKEDSAGRFLVAIIIDRGIGIPKSIKSVFPIWKDQDDKNCITHAMTESITSTKEKGRGKGSKGIKKPIEQNTLTGDDLLLILSGTGLFTYSNSNNIEDVDTLKLNYTFKGTLTEWKIYY